MTLGGLGIADPARGQVPPDAPTTVAVGNWTLAPRLELRTRGEYRRDPPDLGGYDAYGRLSGRVQNAWNVASRARLGLGAERGVVRAQLTLQDARALGSPSPSAVLTPFRGASSFGAYEAFAELHDHAERPDYLRLGRQAVVWGEGRLLGDADFSPTGRSLDAARGHLALGKFDVEALAAILESPGPLGTSFADTGGPPRAGVQLYGVLGRFTAAPLLRVELYALARVSRSSGEDLDGSRFTLARLSGETYTGALRFSGASRGWDYGVEGAYQLGRANALGTGGSDVRAFAAAAHVEKALTELVWSPTFQIAGSYASGDDRRGVYKQFDPLLADPQRFHGAMDLFAWSNQIDASARAAVLPLRDVRLAAQYRYARLARASGEWVGGYLTSLGSQTPSSAFALAGYATPPGGGAELGHEIDVAWDYRPVAGVPFDVRVGWSGLFLGDGARAVMSAQARGVTQDDGSIRTATFAQYAYAQASLVLP